MTCGAELLISVVRRGRGDRVVAIAKEAGARGSTVLLGRGTASSGVLRWLGLADTQKEIVFTLAPAGEMAPIAAALRNAPDLCRKVPGIGFTLDVPEFFRSGQTLAGSPAAPRRQFKDAAEGEKMNFEHELICAIANTGFADDLMHVAREAGATGGTIVKARGTGTEEDSSFFGITIVPEKEMLMILAKKEGASEILRAIRECPCLAEPGAGIVFRLPVTNFFQLGKNDKSGG